MSYAMSAFGPKQTWAAATHMSAFGGKATRPLDVVAQSRAAPVQPPAPWRPQLLSSLRLSELAISSLLASNFCDDSCTDSVSPRSRVRLVSWHFMRPAIERAVLTGAPDVCVVETAY